MLSFNTAKRFLWNSKKQTIFIILGVAIGVSVQVFIGALITGLQASLVDSTVGSSSHITVFSTTDNEQIENWENIKAKIEAQYPNLKAVSTSADSPATLRPESKTYGILVRGFNLTAANKIYKFDERLVTGALPQKMGEVLMGIDLMDELEVKLDDTIEVIDSVGQKFPVTVVGSFDLGVAAINEAWIVTRTETAADIFDFGDNVTSIEIQVNDVFAADTIASDINQTLVDYPVKVENWKEANESLLSGLQGQTISSLFIQVFVIISVVLGIASVLAITVLQKSKQLGILKAMGIKDGDASLIFLFEGMILGVFGAVGGISLGLGLLYMFTTFAKGPDGEPIIAVVIEPTFIAISAVIAIIAAMAAAVIPAVRSSRLDPIEVIRE